MDHICIIAEAGVNHNGDMNLAKQMVDAAKNAGADYVKFQTFVPENLVSRFAEKAKYQKENTGSGETQLQMLKGLALTQNDFWELKRYCDQVGIGFSSTPFDLESIRFLKAFELDFWKIPSGEITNLPYLERIAQTARPVIMSTGMCEPEEILEALRILEEGGATDITLLHCNTQYPTPLEDVNLKAMQSIAQITKKKVGYSDHTQGIEVPIAAAAMGATVIEKHFTLDKTLPGPDHKASLDPNELKQMVLAIRGIEKAMGDGVKDISASEKDNRAVARKSIVAKTKIKKGELLTECNLTAKRPGTGISPMRWHEVIGTHATKDYEEDELIEL